MSRKSNYASPHFNGALLGVAGPLAVYGITGSASVPWLLGVGALSYAFGYFASPRYVSQPQGTPDNSDVSPIEP